MVKNTNLNYKSKRGIMGVEKSSLHSNKKGGADMKKREIVKANWKKSLPEIAKLAKSTVESVRKLGSRMGLPPHKINKQNASSEMLTEIQLGKKSKQVSELESKLKNAYTVIDRLSGDLDFKKETQKISKFKIRNTKNHGGGITVVVVASDWHIGEVVEKDDVNDLNEFNSEIAIKRVEKFFNNSIKLVKREQRDSKVERVVFAILGDMISGSIHTELIAKNEFGVSKQVKLVQSLLVAGIEKMRDELQLPIDVRCSMGNHGRATEERMISTEKDDSFEYIMYGNIATYFNTDKLVNVHVANGYLSYMNVHGFVIRFHHGHALRFAGGIGGIFIPAYKAIGSWDIANRADLDVFGHFHQFRDGGKFISNGSVVGYNAFAIHIRAIFEKPKQAFFVIDHIRKEKTTTCPIFLE
jgi:hypothetical protein